MKKRIGRLLLALIGLYLLAAVFVLPYIVRTKLPDVVHAMTGGTLHVEDVSFNPLILNLTMGGIRYETPGGDPLMTLQRLDCNLDAVHLLRGTLSIEHIGLYAPRLYIVQQRDGRFNFDWLLHRADANATAASSSGETDGTLPGIVLESLELEDGGIAFTDLSRPEPLQRQSDPIGLTLTDFKTLGGGTNLFHFYAGTGSSAMLDVKGSVANFAPFAVKGRVEYNAGKLFFFYHFLQNASALEVADGRMHLGLAFNVDTAHPETTVLSDINATMLRLRIRPKNGHEDVLRIGKMTAVAGPVYPLRGKAVVDTVTIDHAYVSVTRRRDGSLDWQHYFPAKSGAETPTADANHSAKSAWDAVIRRVALTGAQVRFDDRMLSPAAAQTVDDINFTLAPVSTDRTKPVRFAGRFAVNAQGSVQLNGSVTPEPLHAAADVKVDGLALAPLSPYVESKTYAKIADGKVSATAGVVFAPSEKRPDLSARGDFRLYDLLVDDSRDTMPLVSVADLRMKDYLVTLKPNRFFVDTAGIDAFYANIVVDRNKTLNFAALAKPEAQREPSVGQAKPESGGEAFPVRIVRTDITNGSVHFADGSLPLPFDTQIHDVNGQVMGISTVRGDTTFLNVNGVVDRYGVAKADGSLKASDPKAFSDIKVAFRNIDMHSLTPYSGKFVGRAVDSGKLSVSLRYRVVRSKMKGDNGLVINRIELGRKIDSKDAVSLPLEFAIALLEDRDGVIDIDMPVEGNVDSPKFRWGGVVWKAFVNLLTKAVTAPFDLIGNLLGIKGDELKYVPFEPGSPVIDAASRERLDLLADALDKRPKLGLTVRGTYNTRTDTRALKRAALVKEVLDTHGKEAIGAEETLVPALLEPIAEKRMGGEALAQIKAKIDGTDADAEVKARLYRERLVSLLTESQPLPQDALQTLALARRQAIREYLVSHRGVEAGRIKAEAPRNAETKDGFVPVEIGLDAAK